MLFETDAGRAYLRKHGLADKMEHASHIVWTTGGLFVSKEQHEFFREKAASLL